MIWLQLKFCFFFFLVFFLFLYHHLPFPSSPISPPFRHTPNQICSFTCIPSIIKWMNFNLLCFMFCMFECVFSYLLVWFCMCVCDFVYVCTVVTLALRPFVFYFVTPVPTPSTIATPSQNTMQPGSDARMHHSVQRGTVANFGQKQHAPRKGQAYAAARWR